MGRAWLQWLEVKSFLLSCGCVFSSKVLVKVLDMIDYCSYTHNAVMGLKPENMKISGLNGMQTRDPLCDTGTVLY